MVLPSDEQLTKTSEKLGKTPERPSESHLKIPQPSGRRAKLSGDFGPVASRVSFPGCHKKAGFLGEVGAWQGTDS